jgi:DnaJ family protein C protein 25
MMMSLRRNKAFLCCIALFFIVATLAAADDPDAADAAKEEPKEEKPREFPEKNWGTYYDPSNVFCGKHDCYKILGFDYYSKDGQPTKKEITTSYRSLSKRWHPDKNKDSLAEKRFMKINKAYKILTNAKKKTEYDHLRERPDEYFYKYGSTVYQYAPKSDTVFVILFLLIIGSVFTWFAQKNRWQQIANRVVKDAVDGLKQGEGGSTESIGLRRKAEEEMKEKKANGFIPAGSFPMPTSKKAKMKMTKKEMKEMENEELRPLITEMVNEITDFGAGFHQPTWRDLLIVRMVFWPVHIGTGITWQLKYYARRLTKAELNDDEKEVLTKRAVGPVAWETSTDDEKKAWLKQELWVMENLEEWCEMQEVKQLSKKQQKLYAEQKKREKNTKKRD